MPLWEVPDGRFDNLNCRCASDGCGNYSGESDADLDCREKPVRFFFEFLEDVGVFVAFFDELPNPDPRVSNDRNFGGCKEAVDNDENDDEYDVRPHGILECSA